MVLLGDLLGAEVLLDRHRVVRAALDGGIVCDDDGLFSRDAPDAGDDPGRRDLSVVHPVSRQRRELEKSCARVEEQLYPVPYWQLAALLVAPLRPLAAPATGLGGAFAQLEEKLLVGLGVAPEPFALRVHVAAELAQAFASSRRRRTYLRILPAGVIGSFSRNSISAMLSTRGIPQNRPGSFPSVFTAVSGPLIFLPQPTFRRPCYPSSVARATILTLPAFGHLAQAAS